MGGLRAAGAATVHRAGRRGGLSPPQPPRGSPGALQPPAWRLGTRGRAAPTRPSGSSRSPGAAPSSGTGAAGGAATASRAGSSARPSAWPRAPGGAGTPSPKTPPPAPPAADARFEGTPKKYKPFPGDAAAPPHLSRPPWGVGRRILEDFGGFWRILEGFGELRHGEGAQSPGTAPRAPLPARLRKGFWGGLK